MSHADRSFDIAFANSIMLGTAGRSAASAFDRMYYLGFVNELYAPMSSVSVNIDSQEELK